MLQHRVELIQKRDAEINEMNLQIEKEREKWEKEKEMIQNGFSQKNI